MASYRVIYFDARARAEPIRQILEVAGVTWQDVRFDAVDQSEWRKIKPGMPFEQVPVLEVDGEQLAQSIAICTYLAKKYGLAGKTPLEQAKAEMILYTVNDLRHPFRAIVLEPNARIKAELKDKYEKEQLPHFLDMFQQYLISNNGGDGYFVGKKMTYADIFFACYMEPEIYADKLGITLDLSGYPKLQALIKRVNSHPKIAAWLKRRPSEL